MAESNNHKYLIVVILALFAFLVGIYLTKTLSDNKTQEPQNQTTYDSETHQALDGLERYYYLLANQDYINANSYHGSGYEYILSLNPSIEEDDYVSLLKTACEDNGFMCMEIKEVISYEKSDDNIYFFTVQFKNHDGDLHVLPAMEEIGQLEDITDHIITVIKVGDLYKVTTPLIFYP